MQDSKAKSKSRAIVIPEDEQIPFYRMQGDSIVLTGAKDGKFWTVRVIFFGYTKLGLDSVTCVLEHISMIEETLR